MNTLEKLKKLQRDMRDQNREFKTMIERTDRLIISNRSLSKRVDLLESKLIDELQEFFEGDDSPLSDIEDRLLKLEGPGKNGDLSKMGNLTR